MSAVAPPPVVQAGPAQATEQPRTVGAAWRQWVSTLPAWLLTAAFALLYVLLAPASSDLAAADYRSDLFSDFGFTLWDNGWYGGHHLLAYSLLAPPLGALVGAQLLGALAVTVSAGLFAVLVRGGFTPRGERVAALWFAFGAGVELFTNRIPFELGVTVGLAALVAARAARRPARRRRLRVALAGLALALALLCPLASPVAGAFLALAALAWALGGRLGQKHFSDEHEPAPGNGAPGLRRAVLPVALLCASLVPTALAAIAFPEGGSEPFVASAFYPPLAATLALALVIPRRRRALRAGALLYALALTACYVVPTPVGGNVDRLGALLAGPLLACALVAQPAGTYVERKHRTAGWRSWLPRGWRAPALLALAPLLLLLAGAGAAGGLRVGHLGPGHVGLLLPAAAGRAEPSRTRLRGAPGARGGAADARPRRGAMGRHAGAAGTRLGAPARPALRRGLLRQHGAERRKLGLAGRRGLPRLAVTQRGRIRGPCGRPARLLGGGRGTPAARRAELPARGVALGGTGVCSKCSRRRRWRSRRARCSDSARTSSRCMRHARGRSRCGCASRRTGNWSMGAAACSAGRKAGRRYGRTRRARCASGIGFSLDRVFVHGPRCR